MEDTNFFISFYFMIEQLVPYAIMFFIPLFMLSLAGLVSERSGVVNIALEGMMVMGVFVSTITVYYLEPIIGGSQANFVAIILAGVITSIFSLLHAYACISLNADHVISGTALNLIAPAITIFLARTITGKQNISIKLGLQRYDIPFLSDIPILKMFFTRSYITTPILIIFSILFWYLIFKTKFGLRLRACGENPHSADSAGVNVFKTRYIAVLMSGFLTGIGGATYLLTVSKQFNGSVNGIGFLALGGLIFGKWKVLNVFFATFFFSFMKTLGNVATTNPFLKSYNIPVEFYNVLPYFMTIIALVLFSKNVVPPKASGQAFEKGKR